MIHSIHQIGKDILVCSDERTLKGDTCFAIKAQQIFTNVNPELKNPDKVKIIASSCGIGLPLTNSVENLNQLWEEFESERLANESFVRVDEFKNLKVRDADFYREGFFTGRKSKQGVYTDEDMIDFHNFIKRHDNQFLQMGEYFQLYKSQLSIHEGKVLCKITNNSITVTKYF